MSKENISRRKFVVKSAAGIGGAAVAGFGSNMASAGDDTVVKTGIHQGNATEAYVPAADDIIIENEQFRLIIGSDAVARSLYSKATNEECLIQGSTIPISTIFQQRPYNNEVKLAYPCREMEFQANSAEMAGNKLIIGYNLLEYKASVEVNIKPEYVEFKLDKFIIPENFGGLGVIMKNVPVWQIWFLQLPVKKRTYYGDWLQVVWDDKTAVNFLASGPYANIEAEKGGDYFILKAGAEREVKLEGTSVLLIAGETEKLLDNIEKAEDDYDIPPGVKSRRRKEYSYSYYWTYDLNSENIDLHLKFAKMGGFRSMLVYYTAFLNSRGYRKLGDYDDWNLSKYPEGKEDLKKLLRKLEANGIVPGFHFLHSHIGLDSKYVTPVPDHRLNLVQTFTLASPLDKDDSEIFTDQDPSYIEMSDRRRILRIGNELVSYSGFSNTKPYKITGCERGILNTKADGYPAGYIFGVLDVSEFGAQSVYINQNNTLQDEIAEKLAGIYNEGFKFCYYDGSEGVNPPFWHNIALAQWKVHHRFKPQPYFAEGAAKTHFSWHMLSRGNAFDVFSPEVLKKEVNNHPAAEAPRMKENFTHINFGWLGYRVPDNNTVGTQPDMLEYVAARAAAWDCPVGIQANLRNFENHARTADNLEVLRRWEEVRVNSLLSREQKKSLQNLDQEHILLINERNEFELLLYEQIENIAGGSREVRAFVFERNNDLYVVYWHISGNKKLFLPLKNKNISITENLQKKSKASVSQSAGGIIVPADNRKYMKFSGLTKGQILEAFGNARIVPIGF